MHQVKARNPDRLPGRCKAIGVLLAPLLCLGASCAWADLVVPAGASIQLNGGTLALGESSLELGGMLDLGSGASIGISNLSTFPGSLLTAGSGLIELSGDWSVQGSFNAGSGAVNFIDGLVGVSNLFGSNTFHTLSLVSAIGKHVVVEPASIQQIAQQLEIQGTVALPIQIERLPVGDVGQFNLLPAGTQLISHVGVSNVYATGQPLAPTLTNEGGSGNALGWFGTLLASPSPIPATSTLSLLILVGVMLLAAGFARRRNATNPAVGF